METPQALETPLRQRVKNLPPEIKRRLRSSSQIVIFGSYASGVQTRHSDMDVFCVGEPKTHFKTPTIEVLILPEYDVYSDLWLGSELANHISHYGVPLGPRPHWFDLANISHEAVERKERRIDAYVRSLERHWDELSFQARSRYEIKIRRELQRLQLLQKGEPVMPTPILDRALESTAQIDAIVSSCASPSLLQRISKLFWSRSATFAR
ncbi:nucleotidyltransferase domain-containing protein [Occallatibacter riparius]|uniref:nucleotidyltransferase domain-containing protein n=1 Tax=Occallatibacter riparius TaxID=1002689 RepID=UPI0036F3909F